MIIGSDAIEGYDIQEQIGRGGFATVYRAADLAHGRSVAVKVINGILNADERRRFDRERMAIGQVADHPNVVAVYESGITSEGQAYMVLEFATGGSLGNRLETTGPLPWAEAVSVMTSVADAVSAAHAVQIRHRDIKPDNILLSQYGVPKLSDFGIASVASGVTTASAATMTVSHSPPEMLQGLEITDAADVYSMASTFHHLVTGQPPFARDGDANVAALITRILTEPSPSLVEHGLPPAVADVITRGLVKDPASRIATAAGFGADLSAAAGSPVPAPTPPTSSGSTIAVDRAALGLDVTPNPSTPAAPSPSPAALSPAAPSPVVTPPSPVAPLPQGAPRQKPTAAVLAVVVAAVLLLLGGLALWAVVLRDDGSNQPTASTSVSDPGPDGGDSDDANDDSTSATTTGDDEVVIGSSDPTLHLLTTGDGPQLPVLLGNEVWISNSGSGTISVFDASSRALVAEIPVGAGPSTPVVANGTAWVALSGEDSLVEIDLTTHEVLGAASVGDEPGVPALVGSELWVPNQAGSTLSRIDPATRTVVGTVSVDQRPLTPTSSRDAFWVTSGWSTVVNGFNADGSDSGFFLTGELPQQPLVVGERVFVSNTQTGTMSVFDIETEQTSTIDFGADSEPLEPVFDGDEIWVPLSGLSAVARVDPTSGTLTATVTVDGGPLRPAFDGAALWVPASAANTMQLIDADSAELLLTVPVPFAPGWPVMVDNAVWVSGEFSNQVAVIEYSPQASIADLGGDEADDASADSTTESVVDAAEPYDRDAYVQELVDRSGIDRATAECIVDQLEEQVGTEAMQGTLTPEQEILTQSIMVNCSLEGLLDQ